jgi:hypothetical protein
MTLASVSQHLLHHSHHRNRAAVRENRKGNSGEPQRIWADPADVPGGGRQPSDGPQEQAEGAGGGLTCLPTQRERGACDDSGEHHQEHKDPRRHDMGPRLEPHRSWNVPSVGGLMQGQARRGAGVSTWPTASVSSLIS